MSQAIFPSPRQLVEVIEWTSFGDDTDSFELPLSLVGYKEIIIDYRILNPNDNDNGGQYVEIGLKDAGAYSPFSGSVLVVEDSVPLTGSVNGDQLAIGKLNSTLIGHVNAPLMGTIRLVTVEEHNYCIGYFNSSYEYNAAHAISCVESGTLLMSNSLDLLAAIEFIGAAGAMMSGDSIFHVLAIKY